MDFIPSKRFGTIFLKENVHLYDLIFDATWNATENDVELVKRNKRILNKRFFQKILDDGVIRKQGEKIYVSYTFGDKIYEIILRKKTCCFPDKTKMVKIMDLLMIIIWK